MKTIYFYSIMLLFSFLGLNILNSCIYDDSPCSDCGTHGDCDWVDGSCICEYGYEYSVHYKCEAFANSKFRGAWKATENCGANKSYIMMILADSTDLLKIKIYNFADKLCGNDSLLVTAQLQKSTSGFHNTTKNFTTNCPNVSIDSAGTNLTSSGDTLIFHYKMNYNGQTYECSANLRKL